MQTKACIDSFQASVILEGDEAKVYRAVGGQRLRNLDPFVLVDNTDTTEGQYPDHPHRGFDSVGYVLHGRLLHEDFTGQKGTIDEGGLAWMTSGKGIVHAEKLDTSHVEVMTVWVNLKSSLKWCDPQYQDFISSSLSRVHDQGAGIDACVLTGTVMGVSAPTISRTPTLFADFHLTSGAELLHPIPPTWNSLIYVLEGSVTTDSRLLGPKHVAVFSKEGSTLQVKAEQSSRLLLLAGQPINEPIVQYGPFVMNSRAQILQAYEDFHHFRNGFERAQSWHSSLFSPF